MLLLRECSKSGDIQTTEMLAKDMMRSLKMKPKTEAVKLLLEAFAARPNIREAAFIEVSRRMVERYPEMGLELTEVAVSKLVKYETERALMVGLQMIKKLKSDHSPLIDRLRIKIFGVLKYHEELQKAVLSINEPSILMQAELAAAQCRASGLSKSNSKSTGDLDRLLDRLTKIVDISNPFNDALFLEAMVFVFTRRMRIACQENIRTAVDMRAKFFWILRKFKVDDLYFNRVRGKVDIVFTRHLTETLEEKSTQSLIVKEVTRIAVDHFGSSRMPANPYKNYAIWSSLMEVFTKSATLLPDTLSPQL
ncbi:hypothetical protein BC829DRAFT_422706 [Chytridium lagenaria]|nr:hypothetical protein BC829DRAFT_422706 [Chytridium lagenaria]